MASNANGAVKTYRMPRAINGAFASNVKRAPGAPVMPGRMADTLHSAAAGRPGAVDKWYGFGSDHCYRPAPGAMHGGADIAARLTAYAAGKR